MKKRRMKTLNLAICQFKCPIKKKIVIIAIISNHQIGFMKFQSSLASKVVQFTRTPLLFAEKGFL